jgi:TMEM175 potassium channel family protein
MEKGRLEAFSDGVIAIIITIMVLELKVPHGTDFSALVPLAPVFLSYVLSFIYVGIYWNNHHHLLHTAERVNGTILWANLHLLFWLSLIPFVTGWMGENHFTAVPTALYGVVLVMTAAAWRFLQCAIVAEHGRNSRIAIALGPDWKGKVSPLIYLAAIGLSFIQAWLACALYALVAALWFIPDRRFARAVESAAEK